MYPVDLHTHTVASDHAYSNISDYVNIAKKRNIQLFGITNHGPELSDGPHHWHFMNLPVIPRFIDGIGILYGIEANILSLDGQTDCNPKMRQHLDLVLAGFHDDLLEAQDLQGNTTALINTMASGVVHIISHPGNPKFPIDIPAVAKAAAKYNVALEINNSSFIHSRPGSQKNCLQIAQAVKDAGGWIALGSDSHIAESLGIFDKSIEILQAVNFPEERILNVSARRLLDFLASHNGKNIPEFAHL